MDTPYVQCSRVGSMDSIHECAHSWMCHRRTSGIFIFFFFSYLFIWVYPMIFSWNSQFYILKVMQYIAGPAILVFLHGSNCKTDLWAEWYREGRILFQTIRSYLRLIESSVTRFCGHNIVTCRCRHIHMHMHLHACITITLRMGFCEIQYIFSGKIRL